MIKSLCRKLLLKILLKLPLEVFDDMVANVRLSHATGKVVYTAGIYDKEDIYPDCTVQVLTNTKTGDVSVGWWKNTK